MSNVSIPINLFVNNRWNFNVMDDEELQSLADDIKVAGIRQKIIIRKVGNNYEIIDGEHKIRALKLLGWKEVPRDLCDERYFTDAEVRSYIRSSLTRGIHKDLVREAEVYLEDKQFYNLDIKEYADKIGIEVSKLSRILKRNNMGLPAKAFVQRNNIPPTVLDEVLKVRPDYILSFLKRAIDEKWTVEDAEQAVKLGVTVTGESVKASDDKREKVGDVNKLDMVERSAISHLLLQTQTHLDRIKRLCISKGSDLTARDFDFMLASVLKLKNRVDGARIVYSQKSNESTKKANEVSEWLVVGSDDERKDKVERVNAKIKELIE